MPSKTTFISGPLNTRSRMTFSGRWKMAAVKTWNGFGKAGSTITGSLTWSLQMQNILDKDHKSIAVTIIKQRTNGNALLCWRSN